MVALFLFVLTTSFDAAPKITVVMSGLDNPRGLAFGPEGALYVAEAGRGGGGPCVMLRGALQCYGPSGAVTRYWKGVQERILTGLPSQVNSAGEANGPHDISFQGRGGAYVVIGLGGPPSARAAFGPSGALFGTLIRASAGGPWQVVADVSAYEATANPAGGPIDTNPYGVLAGPGARVIADAGANALLRVDSNGDVSTIAVLPPTTRSGADPVPTSVALGPDGAYYVGELTGAPFFAGAASVFRVVPGSSPQVFLEGFKTIIDLDFGPDGSLYVLEHASGATGFGGPGDIIRIQPNGTRSVVYQGLTRPGSIVIGSDQAIYVSNRGTSVGTGEVLKIEP
jgi:hypothetical protein